MPYTIMHSIAQIWDWYDLWNTTARSGYDRRHALSLKTQALIREDRCSL